eukprot:SAG22_NODE_542_length_9294_cov_156.554649_6_plen_217_part_00
MSNLTLGKIANNSLTLVLSSDKTTGNFDFEVDVTNSAGFPHKTRCLIQVQMVDIGFLDILAARSLTSATFHGNTVAVSIDGLSTMTKTFVATDLDDTSVLRAGRREHEGYIGVLPFKSALTPLPTTGLQGSPSQFCFASATYSTDGDILNHGVLCESPFGKRLRVSLKDATTGKRFLHNIAGDPTGAGDPNTDPDNFPVTIKLRLLFLDNEDLKDF